MKTWPPAASASPRRAVPTPGSTTARCTVPAGKYGAAASRASAPSVMSWRSTSWVTSTSASGRRAASAMPSMTPFISATYASRSPKSVVSVTRPGTLADECSTVAVHHEVGHEGQDLTLLRWGESFQIALGRLHVGVRARAGVLHALVVQHEPPDVLDLGRLQRAPAQQAAHPLGLGRRHALH